MIKECEDKFLDYAYEVMRHKIPPYQTQKILADLLGAFKDGNQNFIESKLKLFLRKMDFIYKNEPKKMEEIHEKIRELKENYTPDDGSIFKMEI